MSPGDTIAHYTIESLLGTGGMGEVWLAKDGRLHRRVALKVLLPRSSAEESRESAQRLMREARAAASLTHPNVVSVYDVGEQDGKVFLAMEYVVGKTLRDYVGTTEVPWTKRLRWLLEVARALAAAHKGGLVHRDIKPENVMVRDEDGLVKVLDFGIARRAAAEVDPTGKTEAASVGTLTGKGQVIGTPMYMAPEQIKGTTPDARSDQFAWGVLAFEVLAGRRPWPDKGDLLAAVAMVLTEPPASLRDSAPELPDAVEPIVARALERDPSDRFAAMDEVVEALEALVTSARSGASQPRLPGNTTKKSVVVPENVEVKRASAPNLGRVTDEQHGELETRPTARAMVTERSLGAEPPPPKPPVVRRRRSLALIVLGVGVLSIGGYKLATRPRPVKPMPSASVSVQASASAPKPTDNPEAARLHAEGVQLWRDGSWTKARNAFSEAARVDPGFPTPNLMLALLEAVSDGDVTVAKEAHGRASVSRGKLTERERGLLDALEPYLRVEPELELAEKRAQALVDKDGRDVNAFAWLGYVRERRSEFEKAQLAYDRAIDADRSFVPTRRGKGRVLSALGHGEAALLAYDECLETSPGAAVCLQDRLRLLRDRGDCARMEQDARAWANLEPEASIPDYQLAAALAAQAAPVQSIQEALIRQWNKMSAGERRTGEPADQADLALFAGDFPAAERAARAWETSLGSGADVLDHAKPARLLAHVALETGEKGAAADVADAFEKRMKGWSQSKPGPDPSLEFDELLFRGARIDKAELESRRAAWLAKAEERESRAEKTRHAAERWASVYAGFAESVDEAKDALARQEQFLPMPPDSRQNVVFQAEVGKVYALAGRAA